jgi:hypothetical protein
VRRNHYGYALSLAGPAGGLLGLLLFTGFFRARLSRWDRAGSVWDRGLGFWRVRRWPSWQPSRSLGFPLSPKLLALYLAAKYVAKNLGWSLPGADTSNRLCPSAVFCGPLYTCFASPIPVGASIPFSAQGDRFTLACRDLAGHIG